MTNNTEKNNEKKKRPARQQGVSSIKHYYKIQNLEGILETFFLISMPVRRVFLSRFRVQRYELFLN